MTFVHPISGCTEKEFSQIADSVVRATTEVNKKQTLPNKEHCPEIPAWNMYIHKEIGGSAHETMWSTANPISFILSFMVIVTVVIAWL